MKPMRRADRQRDAQWALEVFDRAPYVTVSMVRPDGTPYGIPLSLARKDTRTFYFHCAAQGEKLDCLRTCPTVSLSAVSRCTPRFEQERLNFTEHYESAVAVGEVEEVADEAEKREALRLICERFLPCHMKYFEAAVSRSLARTTVCRITLTEPPAGKCKS